MLYEAIFRDEILACLRRSLDEAHRQEKGLRIRLRLADAPELTNLPWEYLYDRSRDTFFALSSETPLVRYLDLPEPPRDLQGEPKLRVLAVIASPTGYPPLDVEHEWANLKTALHDLEARGLVAIDRLTPPSIEALQRQLLRQEYHILHFLGHGSFDTEANDSVLLLQHEAGQPQVVTGQDFSTLLRDHRSLRLALLNACRGAEAASGDAYSGVAQRLVRDGIPAVIAMRTAISDKAGIALASSFYGAAGRRGRRGHRAGRVTARRSSPAVFRPNGVRRSSSCAPLRVIFGFMRRLHDPSVEKGRPRDRVARRIAGARTAGLQLDRPDADGPAVNHERRRN